MVFVNSRLEMDSCLNVDVLKQKVIKEYNDVLKQLSKGYKPDLTLILDQLTFIELQDELDNYIVIYQKLNNNGL